MEIVKSGLTSRVSGTSVLGLGISSKNLLSIGFEDALKRSDTCGTSSSLIHSYHWNTIRKVQRCISLQHIAPLSIPDPVLNIPLSQYRTCHLSYGGFMLIFWNLSGAPSRVAIERTTSTLPVMEDLDR